MAYGTIVARTEAKLVVQNPIFGLLPEGADPQDTFGLQVEDFIVINGIPSIPDQIVEETPMVSASGLIVSSGIPFEEVDSTADLRFSATQGVGLTNWQPYYDNTWFGASFVYGTQPAVTPISWVRKKYLYDATALYLSSGVTLSNLSANSGGFVFSLYPTENCQFVFSDVYVYITESEIGINGPEIQSTRPISIGSDLIHIGVAFDGRNCTLYVKSGASAIVKTTVRAEFDGQMLISGAAGIIAVDYWANNLNLAPLIEAMFNTVSGAKRR